MLQVGVSGFWDELQRCMRLLLDEDLEQSDRYLSAEDATA